MKKEKETWANRRSGTTERWHKLDNTANLFPVTTSKKSPHTYRLSVTLLDMVDPELLQQALEIVLPRFSAFRVRLRKGLFWHYLENNPDLPTITPEDDYPCKIIVPEQNNNYLFRVTYFQRRINLEIFHVITDGTGGLQFLKALCCQYLLLAHPGDFTPQEKEKHWFSEHANNTQDSYVENYTPTKKTNFRIGRGYRIRGDRSLLDKLSVIHAQVPVKEILELSRGKGVTVTQYITAVLAWGIYTQQLKKRPSKYPLNIFVPVNLRNLFESTTMLNFFSNIYISLQMDSPHLTFDEILSEVKRQFEEKLNREAMLEKISYTVGSGYSPAVRAVPLLLKMMFLRMVYIQSAKSSSMGFSNVGKVDMPEIFNRHMAGAYFLLSTMPREPIKCAVCSFNEIMTISFTSVLRNTDLQRAMIRKLAADGLSVTIDTNGVDYESL